MPVINSKGVLPSTEMARLRNLVMNEYNYWEHRMNYEFIPPDTDPLFQVLSFFHRLPMPSFWSRLLIDLSTRRSSRASLIRFSRQFVVISLIAVESKYRCSLTGLSQKKCTRLDGLSALPTSFELDADVIKVIVMSHENMRRGHGLSISGGYIRQNVK
jgi:hypothetical protein